MRIKTIQNVFFITLLVGTTLAFFILLEDFFQPLFWAAILAIIFRPVYRWTRHRSGDRRSLAAVLTLLFIIVVVIVPLFFVGMAVTQEVLEFYDQVAAGQIDLDRPIQTLEELLPVAIDYLERLGVEPDRLRENVSTAALAVSQFLAAQAVTFGQNALRFSILFFIMLYVLFFFLRDGRRLVDAIIRGLPLGQDRERQLISRFAEVSRATIKGTLVVGLVQGVLGGLLFWAVNIEGAVFWGVIMTLLALFPAIGSFLVWGPAAIILLATGEIVRGLVVLVVGTLIIGIADNVLRPLLVGRDTQMPDYLILLSTLGGLTVFGILGVVIGPIIAALFLAVWEMFEGEYSEPEDVEAVEEAARHAEQEAVD